MSDTFIDDIVSNIINAAIAAAEGEGQDAAALQHEMQIMVHATRTCKNIPVSCTAFSLHPHFQRSLRLICSQDFEDNQDELPNNFHSNEPEDSDFDDGSEPWYGNDVDRAEYYGIDDGPPSPGPPSPALTQCLYDEDDSSTESELALDIKRVFNPMYYERKRKREEMENGEDEDDA
jgi:hypothetical protein